MLFPPTVWGPFFWHTIHIVALGYPKNPSYTDKKCTKEFYESFAYLIPCSQCREHYKEHIGRNPLTPFLDSRSDLIRWTVDIGTSDQRPDRHQGSTPVHTNLNRGTHAGLFAAGSAHRCIATY